MIGCNPHFLWLRGEACKPLWSFWIYWSLRSAYVDLGQFRRWAIPLGWVELDCNFLGIGLQKVLHMTMLGCYLLVNACIIRCLRGAHIMQQTFDIVQIIVPSIEISTKIALSFCLTMRCCSLVVHLLNAHLWDVANIQVHWVYRMKVGTVSWLWSESMVFTYAVLIEHAKFT